MNVRDAVFEVLRRRGVQQIFGNPGSTELTMLAGLPDDIDYVLCLHEHVAVAAAAGYSSLSGRPSLVNLHTLPGLAHGSGAIATAASNRSPVVITAGQQDTRHLRTDPLLSGPLVEFARPLVKWSHQPVRPEDVPMAFERAFRVASTPPYGPVFLSLPMDFMEAPATVPVDVREPSVGDRLSPSVIRGLADELGSAAAPAIVTGAAVETSGGWDAAIELAERLDAPVYSAPLAAKFGFPTGHPRFAGQLLPEARGIHRALEPHDLVLVAGGPGFVLYPYTDHALTPPGTRAVLLTEAAEDVARWQGGPPYVCDVGGALQDLVDVLPQPVGRTPGVVPVEEVEEGSDLGNDLSKELDVAAVCREIRRAVGDDVMVTDESVSNGPALRRHLPVTRPNRYLRSSNGGLGSSVPAAIGAAMSSPSTRVVSVVGDGSFLYSPQALWTMAQRELPVTVVVLNNRRYKILQDFHASSAAHLGAMVASDLPGLDVAAVARGFGVPCTPVTSVDSLRAGLAEAVGAPGPWVLDVQLSGAGPSMFD
jgi:benzoylformate decarboxylase